MTSICEKNISAELRLVYAKQIFKISPLNEKGMDSVED